MKRFSGIATLAIVGSLVLWVGCSSSDDPVAAPKDTGGGGGCDSAGNASCTAPAKDPENPTPNCGPLCGIEACKSTTEVSTCPTDTACMAVTKQSGDVLNMRMGRIRLWAPQALLSLTALAVDPNVNPVCAANGSESFNWLLQIDKKANTLKTGGARKSADHKTFAFLDGEKVDGSALDSICPGFKGPTEAVDMSAIKFPITFEGSTFKTEKLPKVNIPIFDGTVPIILPIVDGLIKQVTVSADGNCIGSWDKNYWCDGDSLGWKTDGVLTGKITVEDADKVPIKTAGCQSLCAILANDSAKVSGKLCKRGADGKIPPIGDSKVLVDNDAFLLSATFAAYGVTITGGTPPGDTGTDASPAETGTDSGTSDATDSATSD
jgi:hypothetical protein